MTLVNFYKLVNNDESLIYIGSTKKPLEVRLSEHIISHYNAKFKYKPKLSSYDIINQNYFKILLLEQFDCDSNKDRMMIEQQFINKYKNINKNRSYSEFNQKTKDSWNTYQRQYYNNTEYSNYKKDYYKKNKIKIQCKYKVKRLFQKLPFYI
jgi:hypothetical protein